MQARYASVARASFWFASLRPYSVPAVAPTMPPIAAPFPAPRPPPAIAPPAAPTPAPSAPPITALVRTSLVASAVVPSAADLAYWLHASTSEAAGVATLRAPGADAVTGDRATDLLGTEFAARVV